MPTSSQVIAIVDDDPAMLRGVERLLHALGYSTQIFSSAEAFLGSADARTATCVVLDIHLGGISGIELRRQLSASGCELPVIFITAVDDAATQKQAIEAGCIAYLLKPFSARDLTDAIAKAAV